MIDGAFAAPGYIDHGVQACAFSASRRLMGCIQGSRNSSGESGV